MVKIKKIVFLLLVCIGIIVISNTTHELTHYFLHYKEGDITEFVILGKGFEEDNFKSKAGAWVRWEGNLKTIKYEELIAFGVDLIVTVLIIIYLWGVFKEFK